MRLRPIAFGLFMLGLIWLGGMAAFVIASLAAGKLEGPGPAILGLIFFGLVPAAIFWIVGAVIWQQGRAEQSEANQRRIREEILQRVETRGRCRFEDLARELRISPQAVEQALYDIVGLKLFTGYINWPEREIIALEAEQISGSRCPNCGGTIELAGKSVARCPYCGTEIFLPLAHMKADG